jgi:N-acetylornithine carbamoyltransferase
VLRGPDLPDAVWRRLVAAAMRYRRVGAAHGRPARGKSLGLLFFNPSLRTRTATELAAQHLGAFATTLTPGQGTWSFAWGDEVMDGAAAEHIREAIGVLARYHDALGVRLFASGTDYAADRADARLKALADASSVPILNLESAFYHPCQALADAATLAEHFGGDVAGRRFVLSWAPHPKALPMAVPNSALLMAARHGMDVTVARPPTHALDDGLMAEAAALAEAAGGTVTATDDLDAAVDGADVVYAKAWGGPLMYTDPEAEAQSRAAHADWRITTDRMQATADGVFLHCLPVRRGVVVDGAVLDGPQARHLDQAAYRLHAHKALLEYVWGMANVE